MSSPIRSICTTGITLTLFALLSASTAGAQATATKCKDGTTSATSGRGACSGHGGVDKSATKVEAKTAKSQEKTAKTVVKKTAGTQVTSTCADGTTSNATGRGACSGHGGVKGAEVTKKSTGATVPVVGTAAPPKPKVTASKPTTTAAPRSTVAGSGAAEDHNAAGAIAQCKDGMYSHAKDRRGACSRHGGVARWM
ncbi:MAG: DUF3761 domain-containing protein [Gemmatimonadaceae bacterium]